MSERTETNSQKHTGVTKRAPDRISQSQTTMARCGGDEGAWAGVYEQVGERLIMSPTGHATPSLISRANQQI